MDIKQSPQPLLATIKETAIMLAVSERTVYRMIDRGTLRTCQVTKDSPRVRVADIERFVECGGQDSD